MIKSYNQEKVRMCLQYQNLIKQIFQQLKSKMKLLLSKCLARRQKKLKNLKKLKKLKQFKKINVTVKTTIRLYKNYVNKSRNLMNIMTVSLIYILLILINLLRDVMNLNSETLVKASLQLILQCLLSRLTNFKINYTMKLQLLT